MIHSHPRGLSARGALLLFLAGVLLGASTLRAVECERPRIVGAGVLPYALRDGEIVVLLGFDPGRGWTDFGGAPKKITSISSGERCESHEEAALREGFEELRFIVDRGTMKRGLRQGRYFPKSADPLAYRTYTVPIPYCAESTFRTSWVPVGSGLDEKKEFHWVPLNTLVAMARTGENRLPGAPIDAALWNVFWESIREALASGPAEAWFAEPVEDRTERPSGSARAMEELDHD